MKLALAQLAPVLGDVEKNVALHVAWAQRALDAGAELVVFPELSLTGYTLRDLTWDVALDPRTDPRLDPLRELSAHLAIICGGVESGGDEGIYNAAFVFEAGECCAVHRKVYPPTYGIFEEGRYFSPGDRARAFHLNPARVGVLVCEDLWHLALPYVLAADGARIIITIAASPTKLGGTSAEPRNHLINNQQHCAYARLLSAYLVFVNRVGFEDGVGFWGGSSVVSPFGETVALARFLDEDLVVADLDLGEVRRARRLMRHFLDDDPRLIAAELKRIVKERRGGDGV